MTQSEHERARELIAQGADDIADGQQTWLRAHLQRCADCREYAQAAGHVVRALRSQPLAADSSFVRATQARVRSRAQELVQQQERLWMVCFACLFVGLSAAVTTPLFWRAFEWMGASAGVASWVWQMGYALFWFVPALVVGALLLIRGHHLPGIRENQWR